MAKRRTQGELDLRTRGKENLDQLNSTMNKVVGATPGVAGLATAFVGAAVAIKAVSSATSALRTELKSIVDVGVQVERSRLTWESLLGSVEKTDERIRELQGFAFSAPFELKNIEQAAISMEALGKYSVEGLKAAGDAAAIFGREITDATDALLGAAKGELEMLKRFGISKHELATEIGVDMKDVGMQTAEDLEKLYDAAIAIMQKKFGGGMDKLVDSTSGKLSMLADSVFKARMAMAQGGLMEGIGSGLDSAIARMEDLHRSGFFETIGKQLGELLNTALDKAVAISSGLALSSGAGLQANIQASEMAEGIQGRYGLAPKKRGAGFLGLGKAIQMGASRNSALPSGLSEVNPDLQPYVQRAAIWLLGGGDAETAKEIVELGAAAVVAKAQAQDPAAMGKFYDREITNLMELRTPVSGDVGPTQGRGLAAGAQRGLTRPQIDSLMGGGEGPGGGWWENLEDPDNPMISFPEKMEEAWRPRVRNIVEELRNGTISMGEAFEMMGSKANMAYQGLAKAGSIAVRGLTMFTLQALDSQAKGHLRLKDIGKAAALGLVSGVLDAKAEEWKKKGEALMLEAGALAWGGHWGAAAGKAKSGAGLLALAGATSGASLAFEARANRQLQGVGPEVGVPDVPDFESGYGGTAAGGSSPGGRLVSAGAAPQSIVYNLSVTYTGSQVYGSGGTREWFQRELLPLFQEAQAAGAL